jgi:succinylglutamic semialdehyde dehydrogenase
MTESALFIHGQWQTGNGENLISTCPVDDSIIWQGKSASLGDVDSAFQAARQAFPAWWDQPAEHRIGICQKFSDLVRQHSEELAFLIARETGKPIWESRTEVTAVAGKIPLSVESFQTRRDTTSFDMAGTLAVTRYKPHGVCAVLGPFNFPAHLPNGHIVPALIAGNTIVFKPSEITPAVGEWMCRQWQAAGIPAGVINLVQGGRETGQAVTAHPQLDGLFFTGSSQVGKALHRAFGDYPQKILALEMGGNNPLVVHEVADHKAAAYATILSAYFSAGQRCTCARRLILVDDDRCQPFLDTLSKMISKISVGFYNDEPQPFMGTVISGAMGRKILAAQKELIDKGAVSLVEMKSLRGCDALISPGLIDVTQLQHRSDEELFGPLLNLIRVNSFSEALEEANRTAYGLSAGLLSDRRDLFETFIHKIRAGVVNWNRQTTGASGKLPFGGVGLSGNHRPSGYFAADYCSYPVASMESNELQIPQKLEPGLNF